MLDLHCHILPEVDDGAASLDEALAMARFCVRDGITHVVATPHCHRLTRLLRPDILPQVVRLNEELSQAGVPLTILPGSEVQVADTAAYRSDFEAGLYCHLGRWPRLHVAGVPLEGGAVPGRCTAAGLLAPSAGHDADRSPPGAAKLLRGETQTPPGAHRGRRMAASDGRFPSGQPRAGPSVIRREAAPILL